MNVQMMTPQQIRVAGLVGMIRFMQQFEMGQGDYSTESLFVLVLRGVYL